MTSTTKTTVADDPARDFRAAFRTYVQQGKHRTSDGALKSFYAIARDLGRSHSRVVVWMQSDFPEVAREIQQAASRGLFLVRPRCEFRDYIERGEHLNADGTPKHRKAIAEEFGASFRSVTGWLRSEFPEGTPAFPWLRAAR